MRPTTADGAPLSIELVLDIPLDDLPRGGETARRGIAEDLRYVYGHELDGDWLERGSGRDYPTMIAAAHRALVALDVLDDVRAVVLAVTIPDLQHERLLGGYVADLFGGRPFTYSVTEQGLAGPFTALRLAHETLCETGGRAVVLAFEQSTVPPGTARLPARDRIVATVVRHGSDAGRPVLDLDVRRVPRTSAADPVDLPPTPAGADLASTGAAAVVGSGVVLAAEDLAPDVHRADPGACTTGVWETLAVQSAAEPDRAVVVVDACTELGYRCGLVLGPVVTASAPTASPAAEEDADRVGAPALAGVQG
ncbi:hypothetical protein IF650_05325 [Cellulosimicrobium terreum]|nr:hypothetical protein [Cellulosimicrobium terreum]